MSYFNNRTNILPPNIPHIQNQYNIIGLACILLLKAYKSIFLLKPRCKDVLEHMVNIGFNTLPMVILMTTFSGMILALETADWLSTYGSREAVGMLVAVSSIMEISPIFVSFAIAAQAGTAITAELAYMQISEQISALRLFKTNPVTYLISTRILAALYILPLIIIIGAFCSTMGGMIVAKINANIEFSIFLDSAWRAMKVKDIFNSIIKGIFFANYIVIVHTSFGLSTRGGAREVGEVTSTSTLWVTVGIICINAILDYFMYID